MRRGERYEERFIDDICTGEEGFLSGAEEPMHIYRHQIEPRPIVCCVREGSGETTAMNLVSRRTAGWELAPGATLPLVMNSELWGHGAAWDPEEHTIVISNGGLYSIQWQIAVGSGSPQAVVIALEDAEGRILCTGAGIGTMIAGGVVTALASGTRLRFVNRSGAAIHLAELGSDTAKFGAAVQLVRVGR